MPFFDKDISTSGSLTTFNGILQKYGNTLQDTLIDSLHKKVKGFTSKKLEQSIQFKITNQGDSYRFQLFFEEYGNYIDEGVQGIGGKRAKGGTWRNKGNGSRFKFSKNKKPSVQHFRTWATAHGLNAFAVRETVWRQGIKANEWFSDVVDKGLADMLIKELEEMGAKQLELDLVKSIDLKFKG